MDPNNPVVKLCLEGMRAEGQGEKDAALLCFTRAWEISRDDFEACIAAHFVARHQESPAETLRWNQEALARAEAVAAADAGDDRVRGFYPSLYLNMGYSYELLGDLAEARRYYELAEQCTGDLPEGRYGELVRAGIAAGRKRANHADA